MGRVIEIATTGYDEFLQGVGGDPDGGSYAMGLRVPTLATPDPQSRYLFLLSSFSLGEGDRARIRGYRQYASLGFEVAGRFWEQPISAPAFRLPDGNISWSIRRLGGPNAQGIAKTGPAPGDLWSFKKFWADTPALLYESYSIAAGNRIYTQLSSYTPPLLGRPWGTSLSSGHQGTFYDLRAPWNTGQAWYSLDMEVEGPDTYAFFASVRQTAGQYAIADTPLAFGNGLTAEEQFIGNFGGVGEGESRPIYWRVGGSLIVET